jgi:arsenate reductase
MKKPKVLFICIHNSARSQMAAAFLNEICPNDFEAHSAGITPGEINPLAVQVMAELGIDISLKTPQAVFDVWRSGTMFKFVIRVCSEAEAENRDCPVFAGPTKRLSWPFADPTKFEGSEGAKLEQMRLLRDAIEKRIKEWCDSVCAEKSRDAAVDVVAAQ